MLEDLMHYLVEEGYDFMVRSPAANVATVHVPSKDADMHKLSKFCEEHELSITINHADQEFIILVRSPKEVENGSDV